MANYRSCPPVRFGQDECGLMGDWTSRRNVPTVARPLYTGDEWRLATLLTENAAEGQREKAEFLHAESIRTRDEADEVSQRTNGDVEWRFRERLNEVEHWKNELGQKFKEINDEVDAQTLYRQRLQNALSTFCHILEVDNQILNHRNCRVGVDLVQDEPQMMVLHEMKVVQGIQQVLTKTTEYCTEQIRLLRKTAFNLDNELKDKDAALEIDKYAHGLNVHRSDVEYSCKTCMPAPSNIDESDWEEMTLRNKDNSQKAISASVQLRTQIDSLLRQAAEDIQKQVCDTNVALENRLKQLIEVKEKLQKQHSDISVNIREMEGVICTLTKSFEEKKGAVALAETRICVRARRPNMELVNDGVQRGLELELHELNASMQKLNTRILQSKEMQRGLLRNQLEIEEAINVKLNSIGIDETKVLPLRKTILINEY